MTNIQDSSVVDELHSTIVSLSRDDKKRIDYPMVCGYLLSVLDELEKVHEAHETLCFCLTALKKSHDRHISNTSLSAI